MRRWTPSKSGVVMSDFENKHGSSNEADPNDDSESFSLNFISNATIAKMLIEKGVCTRAEFVAAEQKYRELKSDIDTFHSVRIERDTSAETPSPKSSKNWLKRKMSKLRWTRTLGARLFGWEWKKTKIDIAGQLQDIKRDNL